MILKILRYFFIIGFLLIQNGCLANTNQDAHISPKVVLSPGDLPDSLADVRLVFYNLDKKLAYITTLDEKRENVFDLSGNDISLSSDYQYLTYTTYDRIYLINNYTGEEQVLVFVQNDIPSALDVSTPSFSPENTRLIFRVDITNTEFDLATVDLDGNNIRFLNIEGFNTRPKYSPNGDLILTICEGDKAVGFNICLIDINTSKRRRLTDIEGYHWAYFTPDGDKIIFSRRQTRWLQKDLVGLYTMNLDGVDVTSLLDWNVSIIGFSKDGDSVIFRKAAENGEYGGIYVMDIDGENLLHLAYFDDNFLKEWQ